MHRSAGRSTLLQQQRPSVALYAQIFPVMISLSGSSDIVIRDLFRPLLMQSIRWFTNVRGSGGEGGRSETACLLGAILDGLCDEGDAGGRRRSAELLSEYLRWMIKQTPPDKMRARIADAPDGPAAIFSRLCTMWVHPGAVRRLGAGLAFNNCYRTFREEEPLVDRFALELTFYALRSLMLDGGRADFGAAEEANKSLVHLLRILKQKAPLLETESDFRQLPREVGGNSLTALVTWLFGQLGSNTSARFRHKAIELIYELTDNQSRKKAFSAFLTKTDQSKSRYLEVLTQGKGLVTSHAEVDTRDGRELSAWLEEMTAILECVTWMVAVDLCSCRDINPESRIVASVGALVEVTDEEFLSAAFQGQEGFGLQELFCTAVVRIMDFVIAASGKGGKTLCGRVWTKSLWRLIVSVALSPSRMGFDVQRGKGVARNLDEKVSALLNAYKSSLSQIAPKPTELRDLEKVVSTVVGGKGDHEAAQYLKGFSLLLAVGKLKRDEERLLDDAPGKMYDESMSEGSFQRERSSVVALLSLSISASRDRSALLKKMAGKYLERPAARTVEDEFLAQLLKVPPIFLREVKLGAREGRGDDRAVQCLVRFSQAALLQEEAPLEGCAPTVRDVWKSLVETSSQHSTIIVAKNLAVACPSIVGDVRSWFCSYLGGKAELRDKVKCLDLLTLLLPSAAASRAESKELEGALEALATCHFPISSAEIEKNSSFSRDYEQAFDRLFTCLRETCSPELLSFLTVVTCREPDHVCSDKMQDCLADLLGRFPAEQQLLAVDRIHQLFSRDDRCGNEMRLCILDQVLVPVLSGASVAALQRFFAANVPEVLEGLLTKLFGAEEKRMTELVRRIGSCKLVGCMYGRLNKDFVHTAASEIAKNAYEFLAKAGQTRSQSLTGKEMGQFLVGKLVSFRSEVIDGSPELQEYFRLFQCSAYNATMSVITCLQDAEKFYLNYIFKENHSRSELIWARILDCNKTYEFPLEVDGFAKKRRQIVTIRKSTLAKSLETGSGNFGLSTLASHYLGDSSLSQDVTMFDFSQSVVNMSVALKTTGSGAVNGSREEREEEKEVNVGNSVFLDNEDLNNHECMGSLLSLIDYMRDMKIYDVRVEEEGKEPESPPGWMDALVDKLKDDSEKNVKLFVLKLMTNRPETFLPYAKSIGPCLLHSVVSDELWNGMNTLRLDIITLLLSWSEKYVPSDDYLAKNNATSLLELLVSSSLRQANKEVLKYLVELIRTVLNLWGEKCLNQVPTRELHAGMQRGQSNPMAAVQVVGIFLQASVLPVTEASSVKPDRFFAALASNLEDTPKQGYEQASEVLGMALKVYEERDETSFNGLRAMVVEKMTKMSKAPLARDREKFTSCLYHCHRQFPSVARDFCPRFMYSLKSESGVALVHSLEMLASSSSLLSQSPNGLRKELGMVGLSDFLCHYDPDCQLAALALLERILPEVADDDDSARLIAEYMTQIAERCTESPARKIR